MAAYKRLYRSRTERRIFGICGGLGLYFNVDPVIVRILWILVTCLTGFAPGIVAYVVIAFVAPLEPDVVDPLAQPASV